MGWTGCFPRGDSLQRLPRSIRRILRNAAGPYIWVICTFRGWDRVSALPLIVLQNSG